jgi:hypothetical protein
VPTVFRNVTFAGKVADEEIQDFYCACDAFLFPNENQMWVQAVLGSHGVWMSRQTSSAGFSERRLSMGRVRGQNRGDMGKYNEAQEVWFLTGSRCLSPRVVRRIGLLDQKGTSFESRSERLS